MTLQSIADQPSLQDGMMDDKEMANRKTVHFIKMY